MKKTRRPRLSSKMKSVLVLFLFISLLTNGSKSLESQHKKGPDIASDVSKNKQDKDPCKELGIRQLFKLKNEVLNKLMTSFKAVQRNKTIDKKSQLRQIKAIGIFKKEINETETLFYEALGGLRRVLKGDYRSLRNLEKTSKQRLEELKKATLIQEEEYNALLLAEKEEIAELKKQGHDNVSKRNTAIRKFIDNLLNDISKAADKLEVQLDDESFQKTVHAKKEKIEIETVLRVDEDDSAVSSDSHGVTNLIDSHNNQFVLSKPKDGTVTHVDSSLIRDIIYIIIFSLALSIPCSWLKVPNFFAYIMTGIVLGPSGINYLKCIVQIETLGEFGVFFILFILGLEFSFEKLKQVWRTSFFASFTITVLLTITGLILGTLFGINPRQSLFVATCLSLSSTPIMSKVMAGSHEENRDLPSDSSNDYINILMGILVMQDVQIGLVMGLLPVLAGHYEQNKSSFAILPNKGVIHYWMHGASHAGSKDVVDSVLTTTWSLVELLVALCLLVFISGFLATQFISRYFRLLSFIGKHEAGVLGTVTIVFSMLLVTDHLGISMELGCFICGAVISSQGEQHCKQATTFTESLRDFFSCLFFTSIGLHVFPTFVFSEIAIMVPITAMVVIIKFFAASLVLGYLLPNESKTKWLIASGLTQISEFSFVLGSRARRFDLISREVYLVILSVTMLSLLFGPFFWKMTTSQWSGQERWLLRISRYFPSLNRQADLSYKF